MTESDELRKQLTQKKSDYDQLGVIARDRREGWEAATAKFAEVKQANEKLANRADTLQGEVTRLHGLAAHRYKCITAAEANARRWEARSNCFIDGIRKEIEGHEARAKELHAVCAELESYEQVSGYIRRACRLLDGSGRDSPRRPGRQAHRDNTILALVTIHEKAAAALKEMMVAADKAWHESAIKKATGSAETSKPDDAACCSEEDAAEVLAAGEGEGCPRCAANASREKKGEGS